MTFINLDDKFGPRPEMLDSDEESMASRPPLRNMVSEISSVGSKEDPIILDDSDEESSISSDSICTKSSNERETFLTNVISPEKEIGIAISGESFVGKRVAKVLSSGLCFGSVAKYQDDGKLWFVQYDNGGIEDFDNDELQEALHMYKRHQANDNTKPSSNEGMQSTELGESLPSPEKEHSETMAVTRQPGKKQPQNKQCAVQPKKKSQVSDTQGVTTVRTSKKVYNTHRNTAVQPNKRVYNTRRSTTEQANKRVCTRRNTAAQPNKRVYNTRRKTK